MRIFYSIHLMLQDVDIIVLLTKRYRQSSFKFSEMTRVKVIGLSTDLF